MALEVAFFSAATWVASTALAFSGKSEAIRSYFAAYSLFLGVLSLLLGGPNDPTTMLLLFPWLVAASLFFQPLPAGLLAAGMSLYQLALLWQTPSTASTWWLAGLELTVTALFLAFGLVLSDYRERLVRAEKRIEQMEAVIANLSSANVAFQSYADSVELKTELAERGRITRELNDVLGYSLTNIGMMMHAARILVSADSLRARDLIDQTKTLADESMQDARRILHELRDETFEPRTGLQALTHLTKSFSEATGIPVDLHYGNFPHSFGPEIDAVLYRVTQEGLTNAFKHGSANKVRVHCFRSEHEIALTITDNGTDQSGNAETQPGIGLRGMQERLEALDGQVAAEKTNAGFALRVTIPLKRIDLDATD